MTRTNDNPNPTNGQHWADGLDPEVREEIRYMVEDLRLADSHSTAGAVHHDRRLYLLGRIEQILHTGDLQAPDDFFENIQSRSLDMLARFFAQFRGRDFTCLSNVESSLVIEWLLFRCGFLDGEPDVTIGGYLGMSGDVS